MKKEQALALLGSFPLTPPEIIKQMKNGLKQYLIVDRKESTCYCTFCEQSGKIPKHFGVHREQNYCPKCGNAVTVIENSHNFSGGVIEDEANYVVFLSKPDNENLYISCYNLNLYFAKSELRPRIQIDETQRYVFTEKTAVRYGRDKIWKRVTLQFGYTYEFTLSDWEVRSRVTEPVFRNQSSGRICEPMYRLINTAAINSTCMRYCALDMISNRISPMSYLMYYRKHPGIERFVKIGMHDIVKKALSRYENIEINYKETEPHKMLGLSREMFRAARSGQIDLWSLQTIAQHFPLASVSRLVEYHAIIRNQYGTLDRICKLTHTTSEQLLKYFIRQRKKYGEHICISYYDDYLHICREIGYDLADSVVLFPRDITAAHDRVVSARAAILAEKERQKNIERTKRMQKLQKKRKTLEFCFGDFMAILPNSCEEIVREGAVLSHCVGGYAERHAEGKLTIMFLRRADEPDKPYYTIEISANAYKIIQCRGYKNNVVVNGGEPKPQAIKDFEQAYQEYLNGLWIKSQKKQSRVKNTQEIQIGA